MIKYRKSSFPKSVSTTFVAFYSPRAKIVDDAQEEKAVRLHEHCSICLFFAT